MPLLNVSSPHGHQGISTSEIMLLVILSCVPGLIALSVFFGWGSLFNIIWLSILAVLLEAAVLKLRKRDIKFYLSDYSAVVTAVLLGLSLPPGVPWWLGLVGISFAILLGKHVYGGLGFNPFNPAMVAYVILLISFPQHMTTWVMPLGIEDGLSNQIPDFATAFSTLFSSEGLLASGVDAFTGATVLDEFKFQLGGLQVNEFWQQSPLSGRWAGLGWEWVNLGFLCGGLFLCQKRIISWHIPTAMLVSITVLAVLFYDGGSSASHGSPSMHLFSGATMLGAFYIATDPVTAATTPRGKLIYGCLIGCLVYIIRVWGNYPEGLAFAILLGNFAAPLIDHYSQPRAYGH